MGALALCSADLREFEGEPRVMDVRLGEALGMAQPLNIRKVIEKNAAELARYGPIHAAREMVLLGSGARREVTVYYLDEPQTLLICMLSRAPNAPDAREQMIRLCMAYRHGKLVAAAPTLTDIAFDAMERRIEKLERLFDHQKMIETPEFAKVVRYSPPVMRMLRPDGGKRRQRNPKHYSVPGAREMVISLHRQCTLDEATLEINAALGERTISRSALQREWTKLDDVRCG
jgi:hypothetical protein